MKVKIVIVEDELIIAEDMRDMLEDLGYEVAGLTGDPEEARRVVAATQPDLLLMDITLGTAQMGIGLAEFMINTYHIPVIFCTSHADQATVEKATAIRPNGYLVKPFDENDLYTSIELALNNFSQRKTTDNHQTPTDDLIIKDALFIKEGHLFVKVKFDEIRWLTPDGNYTTIYENPNKKHVVRQPLKEMLTLLPKDRFFQTHRSYVINLTFLDAINNQNVMVEGIEIPLGRNFREDLLQHVRRLS